MKLENLLVSNEDEELNWAFPRVDPGIKPYGSRVLVQIRRVKRKTQSGIVLVDETQETEKWNTQIAKVVALGPLAFKKRESMEPWPEGIWAQVGEFVRVPRFGGDKWEIPIEGQEESALFVIFNDFEMIGKVIGNPLDIKAYI